MTISEAVQLVIQASALGRNGEVFVLNMGEPVQILDLARTTIKLMGKTEKSSQNPEGDIEIKFIGLRPGEKLHEELLIADNFVGTQHPMIIQAIEDSPTDKPLHQNLDELVRACDDFDCPHVIKILTGAVDHYASGDEIFDAVHQQGRQMSAKVTDLFPRH